MQRGARVAYCQMCGELVARRTLAYHKETWKRHAGSNLLLPSAYSATAWTATGAGSFTANDSFGVYPEKRWAEFDMASPPVASMVNGAPRFTGTIRFQPNDAIDLSDEERGVFSVIVGPWELTTNPTLEVQLGLIIGGNPTYLRTWEVLGATRCWNLLTVGSLPVGADASALVPCFLVTPGAGCSWFWEDARLEPALFKPSNNHLDTTTASSVLPTDERRTGYILACPKCRKETIPDDEERIPLRRDDIGEDRYQVNEQEPEVEV